MNGEVVLRFVRHEDIDRFLQAGWTVTHDLQDCHHGAYSVLMVRPGDCQDPPPRPY
jgi:hypothetical protein